MLDIVVAIPSRGTIHSRVLEARDHNLTSYRWRSVWSHDKPIPDSHNCVVARALEHRPSWIWILEEDVEPPADALVNMIAAARKTRAKVIAAKYKMAGDTWCYELRKDGSLMFSGVGCVLIMPEVFEELQYPWFRTDTAFHLNAGKFEPFKERGQYGRHDIYFFASLVEKGIVPVLADVVCAHWRVLKFGEPKTNDGCHKIAPI